MEKIVITRTPGICHTPLLFRSSGRNYDKNK